MAEAKRELGARLNYTEEKDCATKLLVPSMGGIAFAK